MGGGVGYLILDDTSKTDFKLHKTEIKLGREVHTYHPSTWEADAGRLQVSGWLELHSKTLFKKRKGSKAIYDGSF